MIALLLITTAHAEPHSHAYVACLREYEATRIPAELIVLDHVWPGCNDDFKCLWMNGCISRKIVKGEN